MKIGPNVSYTWLEKKIDFFGAHDYAQLDLQKSRISNFRVFGLQLCSMKITKLPTTPQLYPALYTHPLEHTHANTHSYMLTVFFYLLYRILCIF